MLLFRVPKICLNPNFIEMKNMKQVQKENSVQYGIKMRLNFESHILTNQFKKC